jgi:hypothetical protein
VTGFLACVLVTEPLGVEAGEHGIADLLRRLKGLTATTEGGDPEQRQRLRREVELVHRDARRTERRILAGELDPESPEARVAVVVTHWLSQWSDWLREQRP